MIQVDPNLAIAFLALLAAVIIVPLLSSIVQASLGIMELRRAAKEREDARQRELEAQQEARRLEQIRRLSEALNSLIRLSAEIHKAVIE